MNRSKRLRIGFVTPEYVSEAYFSGGLANYLYRVSTALVSMGHEVHIVTLSDVGHETFIQDRISVHRIMANPPPAWLTGITRSRLTHTLQWVCFSIRAYCRIRELHRKNPFDILQFSNSRGCGLATSLLLPVPYCVRISCYRPVWNHLGGVNPNLDSRATERLEQLQLRLCQHIYAPSYLLKRMLEKAGFRNVRVMRTPFFLETPHLDESVVEQRLAGKSYLLFCGRLQLHKGFHILVQALPEVLEANPDMYVAMAGLDCQTPIAPSMRDYALSVSGPFAHRLVFVDQTPHSKLYPIIARARLVVLPSLVDNLPNTCLETMALGKPLIGTAGASFDEVIVDGQTGFLVPPGDPEALADKINEAWVHPMLAEIGRAAQEKVQEFLPDHTVKALVEYYDGILAGHRST